MINNVLKDPKKLHSKCYNNGVQFVIHFDTLNQVKSKSHFKKCTLIVYVCENKICQSRQLKRHL